MDSWQEKVKTINATDVKEVIFQVIINLVQLVVHIARNRITNNNI